MALCDGHCPAYDPDLAALYLSNCYTWQFDFQSHILTIEKGGGGGGAVAQSAERATSSQEVVGSISIPAPSGNIDLDQLWAVSIP